MMTLTRILILALFTYPFTARAEGTAKLSANDLQVLAHYHALNQREVKLGKLAKKRASSEGVKAYATMLVNDHGDSDKELLAFAKERRQVIPAGTAITPAMKKEKAAAAEAAAKLAKLSGEDFDREYLSMMVEGHEKELGRLDMLAGSVRDGELFEMVKEKRETLQRHADAARALQKGETPAHHSSR